MYDREAQFYVRSFCLEHDALRDTEEMLKGSVRRSYRPQLSVNAEFYRVVIRALTGLVRPC